MTVALRVLWLATLLAQDPTAMPDAEPPSAGSPPATSVADAGEAFAVSTRLTPKASNIGDLLTYEVTVAYPSGHTINVPRGLELPPLEIVEVEPLEPESTGQGMRKVIRFTLQHFDVGQAEVPSFDLTRVGPDGEVQTLRVPVHPFEVSALLANEADPQLRGDDPAVSLPYPNDLAEAVIYGSLIGVILAALAAWGIVAWRRRERVEAAPPPVPPHELALGALAQLESDREPMLERGEFQDYYLRLTDIAKAYLEGRFGIEANDRTTDEIRRELVARGHRIRPLKPDDVLRFLQDCDLVKFARFAPPLEEARDALMTVRGMVDATRPVIKKDPENPPPGGTQRPGEGIDVPQEVA